MSAEASETVDGQGRKRAASFALECPVCLEPFDTGALRPLSLVCGHSLCSKCTEALPSPSPCPVCRKPTLTSNRPTNFIVLQLLEQKAAAVYACQDCGRGAEAEDAWVCEAEDCAAKAAPPRVVFLACSRCYIARHLGHPRLPLPAAIQLSKEAHEAKFAALEDSLGDAKAAAKKAKRNCTRLKADSTDGGSDGGGILDSQTKMACAQLRVLQRDTAMAGINAHFLMYLFKNGSLNNGPLETADSEPDDTRKTLEAVKDKFAALASRASRLREAREAVAQVSREAANADIDPDSDQDDGLTDAESDSDEEPEENNGAE